jgi:hypothetical protein
MRYHQQGVKAMLYNIAQGPLSDGLREFLINQLPETPPADVLDKIIQALKERKIACIYGKIGFTRIAEVNDTPSLEAPRHPEFQVTWRMNCPVYGTMSLQNLSIISHIRRDFEDSGILKRIVQPPSKLVVLPDFATEPYFQPAPRFYCLPHEVTELRQIALKRAEAPFKDFKEIDFTKPPDIEFGGYLEKLRTALDEQPGTPDESSDAHPGGNSLIPPSAR